MVQDWALDLVMSLEERDRKEAELDAVKRALLTSRPEMARELYPDWFVGETDEDVRRSGAQRVSDVDLSDTEGEIIFEGAVSKEQAEKVLQQMLAHPEGTLTGMEFNGAPRL